jgi:hypothetical protein
MKGRSNSLVSSGRIDDPEGWIGDLLKPRGELAAHGFP